MTDKVVQTDLALKTNLIGKNITEKVIDDTFNFLSGAIGGSLGPFGYNTIIHDRYLNNSITKDGYTILSGIIMYDNENRGIFDNIIKVSRSLVRTVGDGSTSAIIIADSFYRNLKLFKNNNKINANILRKILEAILDELTEKIKLSSRKISSTEQIVNIAKVSTNNDVEMAEIIAEMYDKIGIDGSINIEISKTETTFSSIVSGFQVDGGFKDDIFINNIEDATTIYENPKIFLCNDRLSSTDLQIMFQLIQDLILTQTAKNLTPTPFIVMAPKTDAAVYEFFKTNKKQQPLLPIVFAEIYTGTALNKEIFEDFAAYIGCDFYDKMENEVLEGNFFNPERLGSCSKIVISREKTIAFEGKGDAELIANRIKHLEAERDSMRAIEDHIDRTKEIGKIEQRIMTIKGNLGTIYVGGDSEMEKKNRKFLVEDAVLAVKSAIKHGYTYGGNLLVPYILGTQKTEIVEKIRLKFSNIPSVGKMLIDDLIDVVYKSFSYSFMRVLDNYFNDEPNNGILDPESVRVFNECMDKKSIFNLMTQQYESFDDTKVINSVETDLQIAKSVFSIITLLVTSNQMLKIQ